MLAKLWRGIQKTAGIKSIFGDPWMSRSLRHFFKRHGVVTVFSQYLSAGVHVHAVTEYAGLRHVVRGLGADLSATLAKPQGRHETLVLDRAHAIIVPAPCQAERLRGIGLSRVPIHHFPCCIELPTVVPLRKSGREVHLLAAGRMVPKKGPMHLLRAFEIAVAERPELRLTYIGDGRLFEQVKAFVARSPAQQRITLTGALPHAEMLSLLETSDVFVQHSVTDPETGDEEGMPVVILEAMALGIPIVSTLHSGIPYVVEHGVSGLLTKEGDELAMAQSMIGLAENAELRHQMGAAARVRAADFTWDKERELLLGLLTGGS